MRIPALFLLFGLIAFSQSETATLAGTVTDPSGAAVPNAAAIATNAATGLTFKGVSNESGNYVISALPPGVYGLSVSAPGFATVNRPGITLNVKARVEVNLSLRPGDVKESIEVTGEAPVLESESSSVSQLVDNKSLVTLPLNGRNYSQLALLSPGAVPNIGSRAQDGFSINGARTFQNTYLIDGIDNNNYILGADTASTQAIRPSVDAVQEFRIDTSNYTAEFGRAQGGVISVTIKSGANTFHGSAFEFLRNDKLDANNFFANRANLQRPPLKRNQFGGTVGGPILRNRTFFFTSYQGTRFRQPTTFTTTVPTGEMARGNFGATAIFDPLEVANGVRQQFPNNTIPTNRLDPVGLKIAALYPAPNRPGLNNNYTANIANKDDENQGDVRVDHRFAPSDSAFVRFSKYGREIATGGIFPSPANGGTAFGDFPLIQSPQAYSIVLNETHVFSPTLVNEFRAGYTRNQSDQNTPATAPLFADFGLPGLPVSAGINGLPTFTLVGFGLLGDRTFTPNPKLSQVRQFTDTLSWVRGNHTIKFGGDTRFTQNFGNSGHVGRGSFTFNGQFTSRTPGQGAGSSLADLLLGQTSSAQVATQLRGDYRDQYYAVFVNDTWKATRKLTLNLGLRYEIQTPFYEHNNRQGSFDINPSSPTFGTIVPASGDSLRSRGFSNVERANFGPRLGFAYQLDSKTVIRGAGGLFYGGPGYQATAQLGANNPPYFVNITTPSASTAAASSVVLSRGFAPGILNPANAVNPAAVALPEDLPLAHVYQGNFGVQRELPGQLVLTTSWVGSGSSFLAGQIDVNQPVPGAGALNPRRRFPTFGAITLVTPFAHSTYHSLQTKLEKRFSRGLSLLTSYTWSHAIDNSVNGEDTGNGPVIPQNPLDTDAEKASSVIDQRHRFVTSFIYEPRLGKAGALLGGSAFTRAVFGGWQLGGIFTASTGSPMTPAVNPNSANTTGTARPNRLADGNLPRDQRTVDRWYDRTAFAPAPSFNYGNSGRNVLIGPGLVNLDALIGRNFQVTEALRLEFRGEFYNTSNSVHFARPNLTVTLPQAGQITNTIVPNRQVQVGFRLAF